MGKSWKPYVCSKEGFIDLPRRQKLLRLQPKRCPKPEAALKGGKLRQQRAEIREGCQANILLRSTDDGKFETIKFHKGHVHHLCTPSRRQFLTSNINVSSIHKDMVCKYARTNVGLSKGYHLLKEQVGGYEHINCTQKDLQNYHKDLKALIKDTNQCAHIYRCAKEQKGSRRRLLF